MNENKCFQYFQIYYSDYWFSKYKKHPYNSSLYLIKSFIFFTAPVYRHHKLKMIPLGRDRIVKEFVKLPKEIQKNRALSLVHERSNLRVGGAIPSLFDLRQEYRQNAAHLSV